MLDERQAPLIAIASGIAAAFSDAAPTGSPGIDRMFVGLVVAAVTWAAGAAAWWAVSASAGIAAVAAIDPLLTVVGVVAFVGGLWIRVHQRDLGAVRAVVAATVLNVLARSELEGFFGSSAVVGIGIGVALFGLGLRCRRHPVRRVACATVGLIGAMSVLAVLGFALTATSAQASLSDGHRLAAEGLADLRQGNFDEASASFDAAGQAFTSASEELDGPWALPSRLVPVVAQNASALTGLAEAGGEISTQLGSALAAIDPEQLRLDQGQIDLAALESILAPLTDVQASLVDLDKAVVGAGSPWLLEPMQTRLARLADDIDFNGQQLEIAINAVELAPELLGDVGSRRYLIIFTTPAEARGLGGFMGNFAEVEAVDGRLSMTRFGRTTELNLGGPDPLARVITGPPEWLDQWGWYGLRREATGATGPVPWSNITMSPHFPSTGQVIAELYPQSGGRPLDGVFAMDPFVVASLLELTGPIQIPPTDQELNADNVVNFLLSDQYLVDTRAGRIDLLEEVFEITIERILTGALPDATRLADSLGDVVQQGRLVGWSAHSEEQALFEAANISGSLPELDGGDGVAVVFNNAAANKIDVYLERRLTYRATVDQITGQVDGQLELTLTNTAPATGLPEAVIGNLINQPAGTSRSLVSFYTALPVLSASHDGEPLTLVEGREQGWNTAMAPVTLPPGGSTTIVLALGGQLNLASGYTLSTRPQPIVLPEQHDLLVISTAGNELVALQQAESAPRILRAAV